MRKRSGSEVLLRRFLHIVEPECLVPAVIDFRNKYRTTGRIPVIVLPEWLALCQASVVVEPVGAQRIVLPVVIGAAVELVGAGLSGGSTIESHSKA